jgi:outer membrane protein, multidrug efflux system
MINRTRSPVAPGLLTVLLTVQLLGGCAAVGPTYEAPQAKDFNLASQWQAPVPKTDATALNNLKDWWASFNDPLLLDLISKAQTNNPNIAAAAARIDGARASLKAAGASQLPSVNGNVGLQRQAQLNSPIATVGQIGVDAGWEIDLFGSVRRGVNSAQAQLQAREFDWHDARTSIAAEVASLYIALKACEASLQIQQLEVQSQAKTLELSELKVKAGFSAPTEANLLRASLTNSRNQLTASQSECASIVNALAFLTGVGNADISSRSAANLGVYPKPNLFAVETIPAQLLTRRPDIAAAERSLAAASEEIGVAAANRYPRLTLSGNLGWGTGLALGRTNSGLTWGFGPNLSIPIFDSGRLAAVQDAAQARFVETQALMQLKLQAAVREVQDALIRYDAAKAREASAAGAVADFEAFYKAAETRWKVGVGSLLELEEARRLAANARAAQIRLEQERLTQAINLYKALGGGWTPNTSLGAKQ